MSIIGRAAEHSGLELLGIAAFGIKVTWRAVGHTMIKHATSAHTQTHLSGQSCLRICTSTMLSLPMNTVSDLQSWLSQQAGGDNGMMKKSKHNLVSGQHGQSASTKVAG